MERHGIVLGLCFSAIATLVGCKREPPPPPTPPPPPAPAAAPEPAKPVAPVYAPDKAAELLKQLEGCENDFNCDAYKPLVSFGDKVSMQLAAIATDSTKKGQKVAIQALGEIKDPRVGMQLFDAGRKTKDFMVREALAQAAGKSGNEDVFAAATKLYAEKMSTDNATVMTEALAGFGGRSADWALAKLPSAKRVIPAATLADVVVVTTKGKPDYLPKVTEAIGKAKHEFARHRLAVAAIELGDMQKFDLLAAGLKDKDADNVGDAVGRLNDVLDKIPPARKAEFVKLVGDAKEALIKGYQDPNGAITALEQLRK